MSYNRKKNNSKVKAFNILNDKIMSIGKSNNINYKKPISRHDNVTPNYVFEIIGLMKNYHPMDLFKTIVIAETWLENINNFVKFSLLFELYFSIELKDFGNKRIIEYKDFSEILKNIYKIVPHNPMIEDFYPVADWGEIKYSLDGKSYKILYGSPLTDNYSYLKAFEICYFNNEQAYQDLKNIIEIQDNLIESVVQEKIEDKEDKDLYIPTESFRNEMLFWLEKNDIKNDNKELNISNGEMQISNNNFYDRYQNAEVNLYCYFSYENKLYPFSIRNHIAVLVEKYDLIKTNILSNTVNNLSQFLFKNMERLICHNFKIRTRKSIFPYVFSGVFQSRAQTYFVLHIDEQGLNNLNNLIGKIKEIMSEPQWGIQVLYTTQVLQPKGVDGRQLNFNNLKIIIVLPSLTTKDRFLSKVKEKNIELVSVNEFISRSLS